MMQIEKSIAQQIREHRKAKVLPIWKVLRISKCWIGYPTQKFVIWWGKRILAHADNYRDAIKKRREIWEMA